LLVFVQIGAKNVATQNQRFIFSSDLNVCYA